MSKEAWKDTGNCRECRRNGYCAKRCRANKEACRIAVMRAVMQMRWDREPAQNNPCKDKPE